MAEFDPPVPIETTSVAPLFVAEADELEIGLEPTGASQQTREDAISNAREFRGTLIEQTFKRIKDVVGRESRLGIDRKRFTRTERRRQNYIEANEAKAREWIDELLFRLDPDNETDQAFITNQLKEIFIALKYRLLVVEMETRRLAFFIYGESTYTKETREDRVARIVYKSGEEELDIAELILAEIDGMRHEEGMTDHAIFRELVKKYHEDVSSMTKSKEITQLIYGLYDAAQQRFII